MGKSRVRRRELQCEFDRQVNIFLIFGVESFQIERINYTIGTLFIRADDNWDNGMAVILYDILDKGRSYT